ncbi:MAG: DUF3618 domain-containing protein [Chloroflexota bacterium]|nr:DUF3618 domain-containing protein [Chloroflexota bacterium]
MGEGTDRLRRSEYDDDVYYVDDVGGDARTDVEQTRAEMSETIDAIQERLAPERVATEVSAEAQELVDHAVARIREAFPELSGQAEQVARDVVSHTLQEAKSSLPVLSMQAEQTIDHVVEHAIQEAKAALQELGAQARASMRDATIGRVERMADTTSKTSKSFSSSVVTTIKQNPGPAALTALGIGWLVMNGSGKGQQPSTQSAGSAASGMTSTVQDQAGDLQGAASDKVGQAQDAVTNTTDDVVHTASDAADQAQQTAGAVTSQVQDTASATVEQVQQTAGQVSQQAKLMPTRIGLMASENPVPLGLVAVALGSAAALLVPETQREQKLLGSTRDKLLDRAQATAVDTVEKVKTVAEEAGETVEKEAKYQGLTTDEG